MWRLLAKALSSGVVTTDYPNKPDKPPEGFRGAPVIQPGRLTEDHAWVAACPTGAIRVDDDPAAGKRRYEIDYGACIFCGLCAQAAKNGEVTLTDAFELATKKREDLIHAVVVDLKEQP